MTGQILDDRNQPVVGATVALVCDGADAREVTITAADGTFDDAMLGVFDDTCTIEVRTDDGVTCSYRLADICTRRQRGRCANVVLDANTRSCVAPSRR